ncbi:DUF1643 domain-containing protein [Clostridium botulinum]
MGIIKYDDSVFDCIIDIDDDFDEITSIKRRFILEIKLKNREGNKSAVVIMMNPSQADYEKSDRTVNRLLKYIHIQLPNIAKVKILNLYAVYKTNPEDVQNIINKSNYEYVCGNIRQYGKTNNQYISEEINGGNIVIIAWGKGEIPKYNKRIVEVMNLLKGIKLHCVKDLTKEGYPRHPRNWSFKWRLISYGEALKKYEDKNKK